MEFKAANIKEKMKQMPRIIIDFESGFVVEIRRNKITMAEVIVHVEEISFNVTKNEAKCKLSVYNLHYEGKQTITEYTF